MIKIFTATSAIALMVTAAPAVAQTPMISVTGESSTLGNPPFTLGYAFTFANAFTLSGLGLFDEGGDGLLNSYEIGVWNAAGTLLASTTLGSGTAGALNGGFRYASIAPVTLGIGSYRVGALFTNANGEDPLYFAGEPNTITPIANVTYDGARFGDGTALSDPTADAGPGGYIGPNLLVSAAIPEPATWAMMIAGFGLAGNALRRRQRIAVRFA